MECKVGGANLKGHISTRAHGHMGIRTRTDSRLHLGNNKTRNDLHTPVGVGRLTTAAGEERALSTHTHTHKRARAPKSSCFSFVEAIRHDRMSLHQDLNYREMQKKSLKASTSHPTTHTHTHMCTHTRVHPCTHTTVVFFSRWTRPRSAAGACKPSSPKVCTPIPCRPLTPALLFCDFVASGLENRVELLPPPEATGSHM